MERTRGFWYGDVVDGRPIVAPMAVVMPHPHGWPVVMIGGLATSTLFTLLVLPTFYLQVHGWLERRALRADA